MNISKLKEVIEDLKNLKIIDLKNESLLKSLDELKILIEDIFKISRAKNRRFNMILKDDTTNKS